MFKYKRRWYRAGQGKANEFDGIISAFKSPLPMAVALVKGPETKRSPRKMPDSVLEGTRLCDSGRSRANWMILGPREGNLGMKLLDRANSVATLPLNSQAAKCPFHAKEAAHDARSN